MPHFRKGRFSAVSISLFALLFSSAVRAQIILSPAVFDLSATVYMNGQSETDIGNGVPGLDTALITGRALDIDLRAFSLGRTTGFTEASASISASDGTGWLNHGAAARSTVLYNFMVVGPIGSSVPVYVSFSHSYFSSYDEPAQRFGPTQGASLWAVFDATSSAQVAIQRYEFCNSFSSCSTGTFAPIEYRVNLTPNRVYRMQVSASTQANLPNLTDEWSSMYAGVSISLNSVTPSATEFQFTDTFSTSPAGYSLVFSPGVDNGFVSLVPEASTTATLLLGLMAVGIAARKARAGYPAR
jgi:hypothetical protein